ncbi:hypothetical protein WAK64_07390 [Bacillus spongiae]|uniref:DUF3995 domain-containing protein n=1 Tax=Bacillus spongiae TaxID=2683610 RepID=A0ABU8HCH7_9BACI
MEEIELYTGSLLVIIGLSHILLKKEWSELFKDLQGKSYAAAIIGLITMLSGLFIILFHNVWHWDLSLVTTLVGWFWFIKSLKYMLIPNSYKYSYDEDKSPRAFLFIGVFMALTGGIIVIGYYL